MAECATVFCLEVQEDGGESLTLSLDSSPDGFFSDCSYLFLWLSIEQRKKACSPGRPRLNFQLSSQVMCNEKFKEVLIQLETVHFRVSCCVTSRCSFVWDLWKMWAFWWLEVAISALNRRRWCSGLYVLSPPSLWVQGRRESLPGVRQAVRRRFSGTLMLPPLWRRHSCQDHPCDNRRSSAAHALPLDRLEVLYSRALASHDEHRSVTHKHFSFSLSSFLSCCSGNRGW